jgi:hypothetical protein
MVAANLASKLVGELLFEVTVWSTAVLDEERQLSIYLNQVGLVSVMTTLALVSIIVTAAAFFGWMSVRVCRLPITIGTMLLTVISSVMMIVLGRFFQGLHAWAVSLAGLLKRVGRFE